MNVYTMIDLEQVTGFDWDDRNDWKSEDRHGVSQAEAEQVFYNEPALPALPDTARPSPGSALSA